MSNKFGKILIPLAIVIAGLLVAGALIYLNQGSLPFITSSDKEKAPEGMSPQQAAEKAINYINQNMKSQLQGQTASLISVAEENGVYKFHLKIGEREYDSYVTKDGRLLFTEGIDLTEAPVVQTPEAEESQPPSENTISPEGLTKFIDCLKEANFVIYGANWCGWTKKLVEMLGGFDMVKPVYVECTEKKELCEEKGVTAYPTILIKGEKYQGDRTFEEIGKTTGCEKPPDAESVTGESQGGCQ